MLITWPKMHISKLNGAAKEVAITAVLLPYLVSVVIITAQPCPFRAAYSNFVKPVLMFVGLYQEYPLIAGNPININQSFSARIVFQDGSVGNWEFPHLSQQHDDLDKQINLPWEVWQFYFCWTEEGRLLWTDAARYIARLHNTDTRHPAKVLLFRTSRAIILPGSESKQDATTNQFFEYDVRAEDLL